MTGAGRTQPDPLGDEVVALFQTLRPGVLRYLASLGTPGEDGEDILQETFLALYRHLRDGKPRDNLPGWVFRVARNLALKRMRGEARAAGEALEVEIADPAENPEERAINRERLRSVQAVLAALSGVDRECLFLRAEGLGYREIAAVLDISLGSVAASIQRALGRLARASNRWK